MKNPFDPPTEAGEKSEVLVNNSASYSIQFLTFWLGSALGVLTSSWLLSRDYVFVQWPSNWLLALFRTFLVAVIPFAIYQLAKWHRGTHSQLLSDFAIGIFLVLATDLLSYVLFEMLTSTFPTYPFRYGAICFFVLVPLAIIATKLSGQFNRKAVAFKPPR
ncbi:MAG: hypothetical protein GY880_26690 [Planctomycetaceae bacterium]|nr:hypothetical protein [Planctomycetaceae bacterium]